jgi:GDP-D-mannose 3', 5'-epimerase
MGKGSTPKMKTALVLGAGGFIGSHLVKSLKEEGFWVRGVDLHYPEHWETFANEFIIADLRFQDQVDSVIDKKFDEVYQLAADMGGIGYISTNNDAAILSNSASININVLRRAEQKGIRGVFFSSSACVYPEHNQTDPNNFTCKESTAYPANPDTEYGWEKLFSERLYLSYNKDYGMKNKIGRYHNIFGPYGTWRGGKEKAPAAICRKVAESEKYIQIWGDGDQLRSFLYIDECIKFTKDFYREQLFFKPINIGSTETVSIDTLVDMVCEIANKPLSKVYVDGPTGVKARTSDNVLVEKVLGKAPKENLKAGLEETYKWISSLVKTE